MGTTMNGDQEAKGLIKAMGVLFFVPLSLFPPAVLPSNTSRRTH
jgi:hypothetical protein